MYVHVHACFLYAHQSYAGTVLGTEPVSSLWSAILFIASPPLQLQMVLFSPSNTIY